MFKVRQDFGTPRNKCRTPFTMAATVGEWKRITILVKVVKSAVKKGVQKFLFFFFQTPREHAPR